MKKASLLGGVALLTTIAVAATGAALAAQDVVEQRKALMKAVGSATKTGSQMAKGDVPFDAAKAGAAMTTIATSWGDFVKLFPKGTETGGETTASPKIWEEFKAFEEMGAKLVNDATAAQKASADGADAFKAAFGTVARSCGTCHRPYRLSKR